MDPRNTEAVINYDYRGVGDDIELLGEDEMKYCMKQCYKMSYFV
jgi:hypothetical protein